MLLHPTGEARYGGNYEWAPCDDPTFFPGRQAAVIAKGQKVRGRTLETWRGGASFFYEFAAM